MNFALGTTVKLLLVCMMNTQASEIKEDTVYFRPVLMGKQHNKSSLNELANIWMDIKNGTYPNISSGDKRIKVGEPLTILIYLNNQHKSDIKVDECWAYDEEDYDNSTINLRLTIKNSDFQKSVLMNQPTERTISNPQNSSILLYTNLTSFKFPKKEYVYVACSVELCYRSCSENPKRKDLSPKFNSTIMTENHTLGASNDNIKFLFNILKPPSPYTAQITLERQRGCRPKFKHPLCFLKPQSHCTSGSKDPHCFNTKPPTNCHENSQDPKCHIKPPIHCQSVPPDRRCTNMNYPPTCYPGSSDSQCQTNPPTYCYPGSHDPQCNSNFPLPCHPNSKNVQCVANSTTNCYPGSKDPQCNFNSQPNCYPGSENSQCNSSIPVLSNCNPGSQNPLCNSNHSRNCLPGSQDSACNFNPSPICYPGSQNPQCNSNLPSGCNTGSDDPQCNSSSPSPPNCYPGSQDPQCNFHITPCYPGSKNPNCSVVSSPLMCYPGSQNILCDKTTPPCTLNSDLHDPRCFSSPSNNNTNALDPRRIKPLNCLPGSKNPQCASNLSATHIRLPRNTKYILNDNKPKQSILCFFNIMNPKCHHIRKKRSKSTDSLIVRIIQKSASISDDITNSQPKLTSSPDCYSHSIDPRCSINIDVFLQPTTQSTVPIKCVPGLFNRRCIAETSTYKKLLYNPFLPPNCYPSAKDPRCKQPLPDESDGSINQSTYSPFKPPNCYPGSKDPRCSNY